MNPAVKIPEKAIQRQLRDWLTYHNILFFEPRVSGLPHTVRGEVHFRKNPMAGFPDLAGVTRSGRLWALELKSKGGRLSDLQKEWGERLTQHNCHYAVAYSFEEGVAFIQGIRDN